MPTFNFVLELDDDEKDQLSDACDAKVFKAAVTAHNTQIAEEIKGLTPLKRQQVNQDQLVTAQETVPKLRELVDRLVDSEEKLQALDALDRADSTLNSIQQAVSAAYPAA